MCLAIPGRIEAIDRDARLATTDVMGVRRDVSIDLIADERPAVGDWILIHVGFAMSMISARDAEEQLRVLAALGEEAEAREEAEGYGGVGGSDAVKYVDEFRDADTIRRLQREIADLASTDRTYRIMEICGGHTHAIFRFGLSQLLPPNVELIHGPGCPVCVLPMGRMDVGLSMAERDDLIFTAFGDMMRVPGSTGSPLESKARGADIRMVYSPLDALKIARANPDRPVMFFAIGFETTAPSTAVTLIRARELGVENFFVFCNHIMVNPAMRALLESDDMRLDAFIGPGHVSTVIGCEPYRFIADDFGRPLVVSGFEPVDVMQSIAMILRQLNAGEARVENQYARAVPWDGNPGARAALDLVFETRESFEWRGLGEIPRSAYAIREEFGAFDAERQIGVSGQTLPDPVEAQCGEVLTGVLKPCDCRLFGKGCTPENPVGALMVSSEGASAAQYKYADLKISAGG